MKPKSIVWDFFTPGEAGKQKCKFCHHEISSTAARLKYHLMNACSMATKSSKDAVEAEEGNVAKVKIDGKMKIADSMSKNEKEEIDKKLLRFIVSANTAFSIVSNKHFKEWVHTMRPAYKIPDRDTVSNTLLDQAYEHVRLHTAEKLKEALSVTIMVDGWSNIRGENIINFVACLPEPVFLKSVPTGDEPHTADNLLALLLPLINDIGAEKVNAIVTDNAANMVSLRNKLSTHHPHLLTFGCAAHGLNLLIKDIVSLDHFSVTFKRAQAIVKEISDSNKKLAKFDSIRGLVNRLKTYCPTRFYGAIEMLKSVVDAKTVLTTLVMNGDIERDDNKAQIMDLNFWTKMSHMLEIIKPIGNAIAELEKDSASIADTPFQMNNIISAVTTSMSSASDDISDQVNDALQKRRDFIELPLHYLANILDPKQQGISLSTMQRSDAYKFLDSIADRLDSHILQSLQYYEARAGNFDVKLYWRPEMLTNGVLWWKTFAKYEDLKALAKFAASMISIPPTSAAVERNFSRQGRIHDESRNRLTNERVEKLVALQGFLQSEEKCTNSSM